MTTLGRANDIRGHRFGRLVVISKVSGTKRTTWRCTCDCGGAADVQATGLMQGKTKSCGCLRADTGRRLMANVPRRPPIPAEERFWSKVQKAGDEDCWEWLGGKVPDGYGAVWDGKKVVGAHVLSLRLTVGDQPGKWACHRCNNRSCVNPNHLYWGTQADNVRDMVAAGSMKGPRPWRQGELNPNRRLTEAQVREILERYGPARRYTRGQTTQRQLAAEYGVSLAAIQKILGKRTWGHVDSFAA